MSINACTFSGRLGQDVETTFVGEGEKQLAKTTMAVDLYSPAGNRTMWLSLESWGRTAKALAFAKKGDLLTVTGRMEQDEWTDRETGQKRTKYKLVVSDVQLPPKNSQPTGESYQPAMVF